MRGLGFSQLLVSLMLAAGTVYAATEVTVDWSNGDVQVTKDEPEENQAMQPEQMPANLVCEKDNMRLRAVIQSQQVIIEKQQQKLMEQQIMIRRQKGVIRGLDVLRRQGR